MNAANTTREIKKSVQMKHFANIASLVGSIAEGDSDIHVVGYCIGKARGVSYRNNPNGDVPSTALVGTFECIPAEGGRPVMVTPMVFLPSSFSDLVVSALMKGIEGVPKKAPPKGKAIDLDGTAEIEIAVELGLRRVKGEKAVNYEWSVSQLNSSASAQDTLSDVRKFLPEKMAQFAALPAAPEAKQIAAPKGKKKSR